MTLERIRELVLEYARFGGAPYTDDHDRLDEIIIDRLQLFSEITLCIFRTDATLTLEADQSLVDLHDTSDVSKRIAFATSVILNDTPLRNMVDKIGPVTQEQMEYIGIQGVASGTPTRWCRIPDHSIILSPPTSGAIANSFVHGYGTMDPPVSNQADIEIPDVYCRTAAAFAALALLGPYSTDADISRLQAIDADASKQMAHLLQKAEQIMGISYNKPPHIHENEQ